METGSELSKTVATFIVQKILLDDVGLNYICATADRFFAVSTVLANMVLVLVETPSHRSESGGGGNACCCAFFGAPVPFVCLLYCQASQAHHSVLPASGRQCASA